jgi:hypothetical protein
MQLLTMYLNFTVKLVEIGFKALIWAIVATGKVIVWIFQRFDDRQRSRSWKTKRRR